MPAIPAMNIDPVWILGIGMVLLIIGVVFSFAGRKTWHMLMVLIGATIGGLIGLFIGYYYFGAIGGLVGGIAGSFVGSQLFGYIAESAVPVALAILVFLIAYIISDGNLIISACISVVAMILAFFVVDALLSVLTSAIGAMLALFGIVFIGSYFYYPPDQLFRLGVMFSLILFFAGLAVQLFTVKEEREALRARFSKQKQQQ
jgi:hypothetical protein